MSKKGPYRILVTGVGAIIGYGVIKSIRRTHPDAYIIGMDIYEDAVGQAWCNEFIQAKMAADPEYIQFLKDVIHSKNCDLVFFGTEQEIYRVDGSREEMGEDLKKIVINKSDILKLSSDKWITREYLLNNALGEYAIPSVIEGDYEQIAQQFGNEFLMKPRSSYASKGIHRVLSRVSFDFYKKRMGDGFMAQKLVGDVEHEYTVGVFGYGDGTCSNMITLKRKLSQEGATAKAWVVSIPSIDRAVERFCKALKPIGPTNFQFRMEGDQCYLLEINPRISSSTSIRAALGYNEAELSIQYYLEGKKVKPVIKTGRAMRYIDEVVIVDE